MVLRFIYLILIFSLFISCGRQKQEVVVQKRENRKTSEESRKEKTENNEIDDSESETRKIENSKPVSISTSEVNEYIGKEAEVSGYVADVVIRPKVIYLNFDKKYPKNTFTGVIFPADADKFGDVEQFRNKNVTVRGRIETFNGKPQIILNQKEQLSIIN